MQKPGPQDPAGKEPELPTAAAGDTPPDEDQETLDLAVERIDTEGVLKEGFAGQEM